MNVLVTGANGLLAANTIRKLIESGHSPKGMLRASSNKKSLVGVKFESFTGNLLNKEDLQNAAKGCSAMIHVAACTALNVDYNTYKKVNIDATALTIEIAKELEMKRYIFVSTANTLGNGTKDMPGNENKPFMNWLKPMGYAYSKYKAEQLVINEVRENNFPAIIVNPTFLIGPFDAKPSSGKMITYIAKNRILFYPRGGKNFVPVSDAAQAIVNALSMGKPGENYLLAGENLSYREFYRLVRKQIGKKALMIPVSAWLLSCMGRLIGFISNVFSLNTSFNSIAARMLNSDNYYSGEKAKSKLKMPETPIYRAVEDTIKWFKNNGYLS